jgi:xanthine dehydrogenase accessory factor
MDRIIVIKGGGDIGTAVAVRLHRAALQVVVAEDPGSPILRRGVSFGAAIDLGESVVQGVRCRPAETAIETKVLLAQQMVPLWTAGWSAAIDAICPQVLVDARMAKQEKNVETTRGHAPLVIGLGPGFTAGEDVHLVIETNHGPHLGRIIRKGAAEPYSGVVSLVQGRGKERYLYAPTDGTFLTTKEIGTRIESDEVIGRIAREEFRAQFPGIVRGIVKSGTLVRKGQKLVDVDPRGVASATRAFTHRALKIAEAVLLAIEEWERREGGDASPCTDSTESLR